MNGPRCNGNHDLCNKYDCALLIDLCMASVKVLRFLINENKMHSPFFHHCFLERSVSVYTILLRLLHLLYGCFLYYNEDIKNSTIHKKRGKLHLCKTTYLETEQRKSMKS